MSTNLYAYFVSNCIKYRTLILMSFTLRLHAILIFFPSFLMRRFFFFVSLINPIQIWGEHKHLIPKYFFFCRTKKNEKILYWILYVFYSCNCITPRFDFLYNFSSFSFLFILLSLYLSDSVTESLYWAKICSFFLLFQQFFYV